MTVLYPRAFGASPAAGFDGHFDWDFLLPAFAPTRIQPMDLDCVIERGGHFLCFETKNGLVPIPEGQRITLETLVRKHGWKVIVLHAKRPEDIAGWDVWQRDHGDVVKLDYNGDALDLVARVREWFLKASDTARRVR